MCGISVLVGGHGEFVSRAHGHDNPSMVGVNTKSDLRGKQRSLG